jgi:hypothetical protein
MGESVRFQIPQKFSQPSPGQSERIFLSQPIFRPETGASLAEVVLVARYSSPESFFLGSATADGVAQGGWVLRDGILPTR